DLDGDGTFGGGEEPSGALGLDWSELQSYGFVPGGSHTVAVQVTDSQSNADTALWVVNIGPGHPPAAEFESSMSTSSISLSELHEFGFVYLDASYSQDPDWDSLDFTWDLDGDGTFG